jgi:transcriptional regulator with XRE-family HTH domain
MSRSVEVPITGRVLDWAIAESGLSIDELAASTGVSVETLEDWKTERTRPRLTELRKLATKPDSTDL